MSIPSHNSPKKRRRSGPIAALVLVALLVLYPLSQGPAFYLLYDGYLSEATFQTAYWPFDWCLYRIPGRTGGLIRSAWMKYLMLWSEQAMKDGRFLPYGVNG
ncbi:MAG: hypothetical protein HY000_01500 [Planctomycetes bacterium]|nr:hypothetical protein [Planctomycetota bacterium]